MISLFSRFCVNPPICQAFANNTGHRFVRALAIGEAKG
jgi:hypothetical protein